MQQQLVYAFPGLASIRRGRDGRRIDGDASRRQQVVLSFGVGAAALLAIGLFVLRNVASTGSRPAATIPAQMAPPPAASLPSTPDLGAAVAIPISKPALEAPNKPDEKAPSLEKKRKKKKNGLLVND